MGVEGQKPMMLNSLCVGDFSAPFRFDLASLIKDLFLLSPIRQIGDVVDVSSTLFV